MKKMTPPARILVVLASLSFIATFFLPFWEIYLIAPQYPEGLAMQIWLNKLTGQVDIINGLNHYIGMKHIKQEMFPELRILPYIMGVIVALGLLVALIGRRQLLLGYLILLFIGAGVAMYDFYSWGYDYGHNLDPTAAIQVPGLSYQPPLIGHKKLLNFDAYSYPVAGGWIVVAGVLLMAGVWFFEWRRGRKTRVGKRRVQYATAVMLILATAFTGCSTEPQKIAYGKDLCDECRMTIMDAKFGAEIVTKKGKAYKFDDAHCIGQFLRAGKVAQEDIAQTLFTDYENGEFVDVQQVLFVVSPQLKSPMNSNAAAFATKKSADEVAVMTKGKVLDWPALYNSL
ncbi:MAG TPA: nitrous oxide reductase accessory protein NosL [Chitinophagaceae bacterium]